MAYYKTNAIYEALSKIEHHFQWVVGNAWLLVYGNKSDNKAKILVLVHGYSWSIQTEIIDTLKFIAKKMDIPVYKIIFDDSQDTSISEVAFSNSLDDEGKMYWLSELKVIFKNVGLDITDDICDKYLNDSESSAYHRWQRNSLGNKITVSDIDLIRINKNSKEPIEFIELKRSTANVLSWNPYSDDFINFNLIDTIAQQIKIPLTIIYNKMIKDKKTKVISEDIHDPVSIFSFSNNNFQVVKRNYNFHKFVCGTYIPICEQCNTKFTPKYDGAPLCFSCWCENN